MIRYYICPVIGTGVGGDPYRPKAFNYPSVESSAAIDIGIRNWCLVRVKADDFTAINADTECVDVLERLSDVSGANSRQELEVWLKSKAVGEFPNPVRNRISSRLTAIGVSIVGINNQTTLWNVLLRVFRVLEPNNKMEDM